MGIGISGLISGNIGRVNKLWLGKHVFNDMITSFPNYNDAAKKTTQPLRNGNLGADVLNHYELTKIMRWLGCTGSINLDGGGSTTLWVSSFSGNGIVNYPSDNKKWDHEGERKVANVILLKKKQ